MALSLCRYISICRAYRSLKKLSNNIYLFLFLARKPNPVRKTQASSMHF
jgi:hypothetical protein